MRAITLEDKQELQSHFSNIGESLSEYCFSNIFLFRKKHRYQILKEGDCLLIRGKSYDGLDYVMPGCDLICHPEPFVEKVEQALHKVDMIFPIPEGWLSYFPESHFRYEALEEDMDYLFTREKLRDYPGKKLHKKRNLVRQFYGQYKNEIVSLKEEWAREQAQIILDHWQSGFPLGKEETDYYPCSEALQLFDPLDLEGFLFLADGEPAGFTLGECVNQEVYGLHFAKADKSVKGIYQFMFSKTAELISPHYRMLNLEQDLGSQPLRAAKSSYLPDSMAKKYRIFLK